MKGFEWAVVLFAIGIVTLAVIVVLAIIHAP